MVLLLMFLVSTLVWGKKVREYIPAVDGAHKNDSLSKTAAPPNEILPQQVGPLIDSISTALNCRIKIKQANISTTLNARPSFVSLFRKRENRKYIIRVNANPNFKGIHNHAVPEKARIGLWVHELMHIKDYQSRSTLGILKRGVQYLTKGGRKVFEHEIDRMVVTNGYGEQLYHWAKFIMYDAPASESYKAYKQSIYLTPVQIKVEMGHFGPYAAEN